MDFRELTPVEIERLAAIVGPEHVLTGDHIPDDYSRDELGDLRRRPSVVVEPGSAAEISRIMAFASEHVIPVTVRGSGTGLCGGCVPERGGILLLTTRLNRILEIDTDNLTATVEPGVILLDFQEEVERLGLLYAPDPGERSATIGGNVSTNAGGMRAVKYGVTRDHVLGLEVVLPTGEIVRLGGKTVKNSSGYSLLHLMIGSEGTLGIITKIVVKLLPRPQRTVTLLVPFPSLSRAIGTVPKMIKSRYIPQSMEFMEREVMLHAEEYLGKAFPHTSAPAYLLLRFDGETREDLEQAYDRVAQICLEEGAEDVLIADTVDRQASLWDARAVLLEALKASGEMDEADVVVPPRAIAAFVDYTKELEGRFGLRIRSFGHAGDGNVHVYIMRGDLDETTWKRRKDGLLRALYAKGRELGGQISGEHGIGAAKRQYLIEALEPPVLELQRRIKAAFDPLHILNPGKVI